MKQKLSTLALLSALAFFTLDMNSCEEVAPPVFGESFLFDSTYLDLSLPPVQDRVILLEDFTGVQCVNCPTAHELSDELLKAYPDQLATVALHNYFVGAYPNSDEDFRIREAFDIDNLLGPTTLWPAGAVNRKIFPSEGAILLETSKWTGYIEDELTSPAPVHMAIEVEYNSSLRQVEALITAHFLEDLEGDIRLSVMLSESDIIDPQLTGTGVVDDYRHQHVLRDMPTPSTGSVIDETERGRVIIRGYAMPLEDHWADNHLEVIAFVHRGEASNHEVLQAIKVYVE